MQSHRLFNIHWNGYSILWLLVMLHGWCHVKLLLSWHMFRVCHTTMHQFTVSSYSNPHTQVHSCLAITCHLYFYQTDCDVLDATAATQAWSRHQNKSQHRKLMLKKKILRQFLPGSKPIACQSHVQHSTTELFPLPSVSGWVSLTFVVHHCNFNSYFLTGKNVGSQQIEGTGSWFLAALRDASF